MPRQNDKKPRKIQKTLFNLQKPQKLNISKQPSISVDHHNNLTGEVPVNSNDSPPAPAGENQDDAMSTCPMPPGFIPIPVGNSENYSTKKSLAQVESTAIPNPKLPKAGTLRRWKKLFDWLVITERNTMVCKICVAQKDKIMLKYPSNQTAFITGSSNFKRSALNYHQISGCHDTGVRETAHEKAADDGNSVPPKYVFHEIPTDSAISSSFQKMSEVERAGIKKLIDIAYFIALKGRPFTDFQSHIELEKLHGVKFDTSSYENETACREFIMSIASYLFDEDIRKKLLRVNFIAILIDGTTDRAVKEQEVLYVVFVDPDSHKPTLGYFECLELSDLDQTADGMMEAIKRSFKHNNLENLWKKIIYLSADGASVNSGKDSGLIAKLQEENEWILFVWCFSHRLELALKDALADFTKPVDESLMHLYYLYQKSSKKLRELKKLFKDIKGDFEMFGDGVKPVKSTGTRWIDHRLRAMERVIDKFGLYTRHLGDFISREKNGKNRATVQGKLNKLLEAQVILRSAFLRDILTPAKVFSLITQKENPNIIEIVESVEKTKKEYKKLLRKFRQNKDLVFELPALKSVVSEIEGNADIDGEPLYHGQKVAHYGRAKQYIADHCCFLIESIIQCYENRYYFDTRTDIPNALTNDHLVLHICKILNSALWPSLPQDDDHDEDILKVQLLSLKKVFRQFSSMDIFRDVKEEDVVDEYIEIVRFVQVYFDFENIDQFELWHKILLQCKDTNKWSAVKLVIEICLCTPCSNASLERFFNQLKIVKTDQRTTLSDNSLNSILRIKLRGNSVTEFNNMYSDSVLKHWYNQKPRRIHQKRRKEYRKRKSVKKSRASFDVRKFTSDVTDSSSSDNSDSDESTDLSANEEY